MHLFKKFLTLLVLALAFVFGSANLAGAWQYEASGNASCVDGGINITLTVRNHDQRPVDLEFMVDEAFGFAERILPGATATATAYLDGRTSLAEQVVTGYLYWSDDYSAEPDSFEVVVAGLTCPTPSTSTTTTTTVVPATTSTTSTTSTSVPASTSTTVVEPTTTSTVASTVPVELIPATSIEASEKPAEELALTGGTRHWSLGVIGFALVIAGLVMLWRQRRG
ncbi:MAG: hypothetical protein QG658_645 [Patescibacteria group bacterium]|jgi:LPXTG-motif cell wall-anchored protein|nr:hypothetical protein [Patescibacteria group bacterium]